MPDLQLEMGTGSDDDRHSDAVFEDELPGQKECRVGTLSGLRKLFAEFGRTKFFLESEVARLREFYFDTQRWHEKLELDGTATDQKWARIHLIHAFNDWFDARADLVHLATIMRPFWARMHREQTTEFQDMGEMELI